MEIIKKYLAGLAYDQKESLRLIKNSFWRVNWIKTIWFNFKILPFSKAVKCPVLVGRNVKVKNIGKINFTGSVYPGMVSIAVIKIPAIETNHAPTIFNNRGTLNIGGRLKFHPGVILAIIPNATITLGNRVGFGANTRVVCRKNIILGDDVRISWNCQLFDTDFHFLYNIEKDKYYQRTKEIVIGDNVFIGNGCTVGKGTVIPNGCVVSCISKISGNYVTEGENLLIAGNPAKVIKKGVNISNGWYPAKEADIAKILEA